MYIYIIKMNGSVIMPPSRTRIEAAYRMTFFWNTFVMIVFVLVEHKSRRRYARMLSIIHEACMLWNIDAG